MSQLTKRPTLVTAILSVAALAGYASYRLTIGSAPTPAPTGATAGPMAGQPDAHGHAEADEAPGLADRMPDIVLDDLAGTPTSLASLADRPLLINFWATWCAPCLREIPLLKAFHDEQPGIDVVGIAVDRLEPVLEYAEDMQFNYPSLIGQTEAYEAMVVFRNDAQVMPFSVFSAPGGAILGIHYGELHAEDLDNFAGTIAALEAGSIDLEAARERIAALR